MKYLIDTHVLLWTLFDPSRLNRRVRKLIENPENDIQISGVSCWEIALKYQLAKLALQGCVPDELPAQAELMGMSISPMDAGLLASSYRLPLNAHRDPFDHLLAWHAIQGRMTLITKDKAFEEYQAAGLKTIW